MHNCLFFCISTSYKDFIPESLNRNIKQRNILTRVRINNVFKKFLCDFNNGTVQESNITTYDLKIKYLATLEGLTSGLGSELIEPTTLSVVQEEEPCNGYYGKNQKATQRQTKKKNTPDFLMSKFLQYLSQRFILLAAFFPHVSKNRSTPALGNTHICLKHSKCLFSY